MNDKPTIAILGRTGNLGSGLAKCWLAAGYKVILGSRSAEKANSVAGTMTGDVAGDHNVDAARAGDIVVVAVPFSSHDATLTAVKDVVRGKIVVDAAVTLVPPRVSVVTDV